ncbi:MAG TPA: histidine kinase dimerization/phospho-acceptor domain-containing protein [Blastocatellia bacterium]|nr:histidine kinase dimerization/phospho-acceptor domain-containing protein [Blastocatellia bacterium]
MIEAAFWAMTFLVMALMAGVYALYSRAPVDGYHKTGRWNRELIVAERMLPEASGLQAGDRIISVDGIAVAERRLIGLDRLVTYLNSPPDRASYTVERKGEIVSVEVPLHSLGWKRVMLLGGTHFLLAGLFVATAGALFLRSGIAPRGGSKSLHLYRTVRVICYALIFGAANMALAADLSIKARADWVSLLHLPIPITSVFAFGLFLQFFLLFPPREGIITRKPWVLYALNGSYLTLSIAATILFIYGKRSPWLLTEIRLALVGSFILAAIAVAFRSYNRAATAVERNQMRWLAWGAMVGVGPWLFLHLIFALMGMRPPIDPRILLIALAALPISLLIAISRHRLLEIDGLIRRSLVYTVAMAAMTLAYLIAFGASFWIIEVRGGEVNPVAAAIVSAMLLAFAFNPLKSLSERLVSRMFYRGSVDTRAAFSRFSKEINQVITLPRLADLLTTDVPRAFAASGAVLITISSGKQGQIFASSEALYGQAVAGSPQLIDEIRSRPERWSAAIYPDIESEGPGRIELLEGAALCLPMSIGGKLAGIYLLAEKRSNRLYTKDEIDTLRTLAHHAAAALEHASAYERLNQLNSELEGLVELRTRQLRQANIEMGHKNSDLLRQNAELARVIKELRETQAALVEAERRAAIGEIIITICHEINNSLTAIMGHTQLIEMRARTLPPEIVERIRIIDQCAVHIRDITERMRQLKKTETTIYAGQEKMIDINQEPESLAADIHRKNADY